MSATVFTNDAYRMAKFGKVARLLLIFIVFLRKLVGSEEEL